jgi:hypothetical protein
MNTYRMSTGAMLHTFESSSDDLARRCAAYIAGGLSFWLSRRAGKVWVNVS